MLLHSGQLPFITPINLFFYNVGNFHTTPWHAEPLSLNLSLSISLLSPTLPNFS